MNAKYGNEYNDVLMHTCVWGGRTEEYPCTYWGSIAGETEAVALPLIPCIGVPGCSPRAHGVQGRRLTPQRPHHLSPKMYLWQHTSSSRAQIIIVFIIVVSFGCHYCPVASSLSLPESTPHWDRVLVRGTEHKKALKGSI